MAFTQKLRHAWASQASLVCVGLDPDPARFPTTMRNDVSAIERFCREIIDATADAVCAFKPQIAYFAAHSAETALERVCAHIRNEHPNVVLILDAKRGDIGDTAEMYAREAFNRYGADAVTVNPWLGSDSLEPFFLDVIAQPSCCVAPQTLARVKCSHCASRAPSMLRAQ